MVEAFETLSTQAVAGRDGLGVVLGHPTRTVTDGNLGGHSTQVGSLTRSNRRPMHFHQAAQSSRVRQAAVSTMVRACSNANEALEVVDL